MGLVYVADHTEPVRRKVALKVIKPGMDTKQVIARFEGERQALALMDHPNIAKVLDAGSTATGRPYFVMEYVRGIGIIEYCDTERLDTSARLELIVKVCQAEACQAMGSRELTEHAKQAVDDDTTLEDVYFATLLQHGVDVNLE